MKKIVLFVSLLLASLPCIAAMQNTIAIPDYIKVYNSSHAPIFIEDHLTHPDEAYTISTDQYEGSFTIKSGKRTYTISYPTHSFHNASIANRFDIVHLDFSTIQWLAGDINKQFPKGIDSISVTNDTCYPVAVVYVLNSMRSKSRSLDPQETISKIVGTQDNQKTGFLELIDSNKKKNIFSFPRRIYKKECLQSTDWQEITLQAGTVAWFNKGFKVTIR